MGGYEAGLVGSVESSLRYHSDKIEILTLYRKPVKEQFQVGSLTGAVASERVTEAFKGSLRLDGNQPKSAMA